MEGEWEVVKEGKTKGSIRKEEGMRVDVHLNEAFHEVLGVGQIHGHH